MDTTDSCQPACDNLEGSPFQGHPLKFIAFIGATTLIPLAPEIGAYAAARFAPALGTGIALATGLGKSLVNGREAGQEALDGLSQAVSSGLKLSPSAASALGNAEYALSGHLIDTDIAGAVKETVTGFQFGGQHAKEVIEAAGSAQNLSTALGKMIASPSVADATKQVLTKIVQGLQPIIDAAKNVRPGQQP